MKTWEREMTQEVLDVLRRDKVYITGRVYENLQKEASPITPLPTIKKLAKAYSRKYHIPVRIDAKFVEEAYPDADAVFHQCGRLGIIYLHPILQYYTLPYIKGVLEHELDHVRVERRWEDIL